MALGNVRGFISFAFFGATLAACGGGNASPVPAPVKQPSVTAPSSTPSAVAAASTASVAIDVHVPLRTAEDARGRARGRHYISPSTQSLTVNASGTTTTINLTPGSSGCTSDASGTTCVASITAPIGNDAFSVVSYDGTNGTGNVLSKASLMQTVVLQAANVIALTLDGVVAKVTVAFPSPVPACTTAPSVPVTVNALDADGNTIVGSAPYDRTISLSYTDTTNNSTMTGATAAKPGDGATISYNGHYEPGGVVSASAQGIPRATATFYPTPTVCNEYALPAQQSVLVFLRKYETLGPDGNVYFPEQKLMTFGHVVTSGATMGTILETPITATVAAGDTTSQMLDPTVGPDGKFYITDVDDGIDTLDPSTMLQSNYQDATTKRSPEVIAPGPDGRLWFTDSQNQQIGAMSTAGVFSAPISLPHLQGQFNGIVASHDKKSMWVAESGSYMIAKVPIDGSAITEYSVPNPTSGSGSPNFLASSNDGYIWFTENDPNIGRLSEADGSVTLYPLPDASAFTYTIALGPDGNMWCTYIANGQDFIAKVTPVGTIAKYPILRAGNFATFSIIAGPSPANDLWFDEVLNGSERVGYLTI